MVISPKVVCFLSSGREAPFCGVLGVYGKMLEALSSPLEDAHNSCFIAALSIFQDEAHQDQ